MIEKYKLQYKILELHLELGLKFKKNHKVISSNKQNS